MRKAGHNPLRCLELGHRELKLRWFPNFTIWDTKHPRARWDQRTFAELFTSGTTLQAETGVAVFLDKVLEELQRQGLCYAGKIDDTVPSRMPAKAAPAPAGPAPKRKQGADLHGLKKKAHRNDANS